MFHIVLVQPLIPQNTGSIARLTAATGTHLNLIEPLGFELSDRYLKRAGLDYWSEVKLTVHKSWEEFLSGDGVDEDRCYFFTKFAGRSYTTASYQPGSYLVFGSETTGLPKVLHDRYPNQRLCIPIDNPRVRSLNLSNAASIVLYEARRQNGL